MSDIAEKLAELMEEIVESRMASIYDDDLRQAAALLREQSASLEAARGRCAELESEGRFLVDRLTDFDNDSGNKTEDGESEWHGHVAPPLSRFRALLTSEQET